MRNIYLLAFAFITTSICSAQLTVQSNSRGEISVSTPRMKQKAMDASIAIDGFSSNGAVRVSRNASGEIARSQVLVDPKSKRQCSISETFTPGSSQGSIRWQVEIKGQDKVWTSPVHAKLQFTSDSSTRFWTAWSTPEDDGEPGSSGNPGRWSDPLRSIPLPDRRFYYGAPYLTLTNPRIGYFPARGNIISLPLASFLQPADDAGISAFFSPADPLLDMTLDVSSKGTADFAQYFERLGATHTFRFSIDLVAHEADWRGPLRSMVEKYPTYFKPVLKSAHQLGGTSAYSTFEGDLDVEKFRKIAFKTNWKASFDFPYMGMFLPPVDRETWRRFSGDSNGVVDPAHPAKNGFTSIPAMAAYSARMKEQGFHVLNYFNVTEFGAHISFPKPERRAKSDSDLWKDPNDELYQRLSSALLVAPEGLKGVSAGHPYYTWGKAVALDCGEPSYQQFLLEQARRHLDKLPASAGICIDRMDWLRVYNQKRDDGESYFNDKPARSLYNSWRGLMTKLLPLMHDRGKVVFVNNHVKRLDLLENIDGIFDEFGSYGASLNTTAFLTLERPALGWVNDEAVVRQDPDKFFQRSLLLGVFPMAPFPGNDHSLVPSAWVDKQYLDYGPLLTALQGRTWVLSPHAVEVEGGKALANVFAVPDGLAVPVVFGSQQKSVRIVVKSVAGNLVAVDAVLPGASAPAAVSSHREGKQLTITVPLLRGCAVVRIRRA